MPASTFGANAPAVPLPQAGDHLEPALQFRAIHQIGHVPLGKARDVLVRAPVTLFEMPAQDDLLQTAHLVGTEGERAGGAHLHTGPAVLVVRGGDHCDAGQVKSELGEVGHRRDCETDVVHADAGRHEPGYERHLDGSGI